jgi:hypothetical protein
MISTWRVFTLAALIATTGVSTVEMARNTVQAAEATGSNTPTDF